MCSCVISFLYVYKQNLILESNHSPKAMTPPPPPSENNVIQGLLKLKVMRVITFEILQYYNLYVHNLQFFKNFDYETCPRH